MKIVLQIVALLAAFEAVHGTVAAEKRPLDRHLAVKSTKSPTTKSTKAPSFSPSMAPSGAPSGDCVELPETLPVSILITTPGGCEDYVSHFDFIAAASGSAFQSYSSFTTGSAVTDSFTIPVNGCTVVRSSEVGSVGEGCDTASAVVNIAGAAVFTLTNDTPDMYFGLDCGP